MNAFRIKEPIGLRITGTGSAFPGPVTDLAGRVHEDVTNEDIFEALCGEDWPAKAQAMGLDCDHLEKVIGLKKRRWSHWAVAPANHDETNSADLAVEACQGALGDANLTADDIDVFILATTSPLQITSSTATRVAARLDMVKPAIELKAGCSSGLYALVTGATFLKAGARRVLVAASETLSKFVAPEVYKAMFNVADGAGAVVLEAAPEGGPGLLSAMISSDGKYGQLIGTPGLLPPTREAVDAGLYRFAGSEEGLKDAVLEKYPAIFQAIFPDAGVTPGDLDLYIPHQVSLKLILGTIEALGIPRDKTFINVHEHANIGSACLLVALHEARKADRLPEGSLAAMAVVGGGLTWGGAVLRF